MHLRRALLLFAIVLGLAAIAASVSRPPEQSTDQAERAAPPPSTEREPEPEPTLSPGTANDAASVELDLDAASGDTVRLDARQPATLLVDVAEPGQVEIPELGLNAFAEPLTPARFELFVSDPGRYDITFTPTAGDTSTPAGTLVVD
ncbi:MAG: hypothetical protein ACRDL0_22430 [Thermoleophilaceae bacterium]